MHARVRGFLSWAAAPAVALFLVACGDSEATRPARSGQTIRPVAVAAAVVEERALPSALEVTGALAADARTDVAAEADGRVAELLIERGAIVEPGAVLARLDPTDARNLLREAEATAAQTEARLGLRPGQTFDPRETPEALKARVTMDRAEVEYRRYARLVDQGAVSRSEFELRQAEFLAARAQHEAVVNQERQLHETWEAQKARTAIARKALADTVIRAPWGGVVAEKRVTVGDYVKRGAPVATLVRVDPLRIELAIPEGAVAAVRKGQRVSFHVQSHPDRRFEGTIAYVGPALRPDSRALVVEALVPNPQGLLQPGLFATAHIELPAAARAVVVPAAAVRTEDGVSRLFVLKDGHAELRLVQVGRELGDRLEIVRGVAPGERVATAGVEGLTDGTPAAVEEGR